MGLGPIDEVDPTAPETRRDHFRRTRRKLHGVHPPPEAPVPFLQLLRKTHLPYGASQDYVDVRCRSWPIRLHSCRRKKQNRLPGHGIMGSRTPDGIVILHDAERCQLSSRIPMVQKKGDHLHGAESHGYSQRADTSAYSTVITGTRIRDPSRTVPSPGSFCRPQGAEAPRTSRLKKGSRGFLVLSTDAPPMSQRNNHAARLTRRMKHQAGP